MSPLLGVLGTCFCFLMGGVHSQDLFLSTPTSIKKIDPNTYISTDLFTKPNSRIIGLAAHWKDNKLYYSDVSSNGEGIYRYDISTKEDVKLPIKYQDMQPIGLAVDWVYGHLYWTDPVYRAVMMSNLDGTSRVTLPVTNLKNPRGVAVDPKNMFLFVGDQGSHSVRRCGLDGRNCQLTSEVFWPNQIAINHVQEKVIWTEGWIPAVHTCSINGTNCEKKMQNYSDEFGLNPLFGVAVSSGNQLYLSGLHNQTLFSVNPAWMPTRQSMVTDEQAYFLQARDVNANQPIVAVEMQNPCAINKGGCSDICIPGTGNDFTCACPSQSGKIPINNQCTEPSEFMLFTDVSSGLVGMGDGKGHDTSIVRAHSPVALTYDPVQQEIYFSDIYIKAIYKCKLDGSNLQQVLNVSHGIGNVEGMSIDQKQRRLYFSNMGFEEYAGVVRSWHAIEMVDLVNINHRQTIVTAVQRPRAVLVDSENRQLFYTDWGDNGHVGRVQLDGNNQEELYRADNPNDIVINGQKLVVVNNKQSAPEIIESNLDGSNINRHRLSSIEPLSVAISANQIFISSFSGGIKTYSSTFNEQTSKDIVKYTKIFFTTKSSASQADLGQCAGSSQCSDICVTNANPKYVTCLCPSNKFNQLHNDRQTCEKPESYLLFADVDGIKMVPQGQESDRSIYTVITPSSSCETFYGLVLDEQKEYIYFSALGGNVIYQAKKDGSEKKKFVSDDRVKVTSLALTGSDLFFTSTNTSDNSSGAIFHCNLNNKTIQKLLKTQNEPLSIAADKSTIYWTESGRDVVLRYDRRQGNVAGSINLSGSSVNGLYLSNSFNLFVATDSNVVHRRSPSSNSVNQDFLDTILESDVNAMYANKRFLYLSRWSINDASLTKHDLLHNTSVVISKGVTRPGQMVLIGPVDRVPDDTKAGQCPNMSSNTCNVQVTCVEDYDCYGEQKCCGTPTCRKCAAPTSNSVCYKNGIAMENNGESLTVNCEKCSCSNSIVTCTRLICPDLGSCPKANQLTPSDSCCPICTANSFCTDKPSILNCPSDIKTFTLSNTSYSVHVTLNDIISETTVGQSCSGQTLPVHLQPEQHHLNYSSQPYTLNIQTMDKQGSSSCGRKVRITDVTRPVIENCPSQNLKIYTKENSWNALWPPVTATDNSRIVRKDSNLKNGLDVLAIGTHKVTISATDGAGNRETCQFSIDITKIEDARCPNPPIPLNGVLKCTDSNSIECTLDRCNDGFIINKINKNTVHTCDRVKRAWHPEFPDNFDSNSCIKPEPTIIQESYTFDFNCPNSQFNAVDLKDCIDVAGMCPSGDIALCDRPFQRISSQETSSSLKLKLVMEGSLPYSESPGDQRSTLVQKMNKTGKAIIDYFQTGKFLPVCPKITCNFRSSTKSALVDSCGIGSIKHNINNEQVCAKCPPGTYYQNDQCERCKPGFYQEISGQLQCIQCPEGYISSTGSFLRSQCILDVTVKSPAEEQQQSIAIVGAALGAIAVIVVIVIIVILVIKHRKSTPEKQQDFPPETNFANPAFATQQEEYDSIPADQLLSEEQINHHLAKKQMDSGDYESSFVRGTDEHLYSDMEASGVTTRMLSDEALGRHDRSKVQSANGGYESAVNVQKDSHPYATMGEEGATKNPYLDLNPYDLAKDGESQFVDLPPKGY